MLKRAPNEIITIENNRVEDIAHTNRLKYLEDYKNKCVTNFTEQMKPIILRTQIINQEHDNSKKYPKKIINYKFKNSTKKNA